jgi:hypothetical protein
MAKIAEARKTVEQLKLEVNIDRMKVMDLAGVNRVGALGSGVGVLHRVVLAEGSGATVGRSSQEPRRTRGWGLERGVASNERRGRQRGAGPNLRWEDLRVHEGRRSGLWKGAWSLISGPAVGGGAEPREGALRVQPPGRDSDLST